MLHNILSADPFLTKLVIFTVLTGLFWVLVTVLRNRYLQQISDPSARRTIRRSVDLAVFVVIVVAAGFTFSQRLSGLAVSLGVAGAAIAFALQ